MEIKINKQELDLIFDRGYKKGYNAGYIDATGVLSAKIIKFLKDYCDDLTQGDSALIDLDYLVNRIGIEE